MEGLFENHHDGPTLEKPEMGVREAAETGGLDGPTAGLVGDILLASQRSISATTDRLYEFEKQRRMALEVLIAQFLDAAYGAFQGTTREYERAIDLLRYPPSDNVLAAKHPEYERNH
jgi:isopenicillin N synthase-like dioxygenase